MRQKAIMSYNETMCLIRNKSYNGAASRAYYALYQAIVAQFNEQGLDPKNFSSRGRESIGEWPHETIRNNSTLAGVDRRDVSIIKAAWELRRKADYKTDLVTWSEMEYVASGLARILKSVNVTVLEIKL